MSPPAAGGVRRFAAPGRVNLLGGHVDYHDGVVVAMAIDRFVEVEMTARDDGRIGLRSDARPGPVELVAPGGGAPDRTVVDPDAVEPGWGRLPAGVLRGLARRGVDVAGFDAYIRSDLPLGAGLSSSAATSSALIVGVAALAGRRLAPMVRAELAQVAEATAMGVPCGLQDPVAVVWGGVVGLDVRTREVTSMALPSGTAVVVVDSGVARTLEGSPWLDRRADSLALARRLGMEVLRDATPAQVADEPLGRHVVSELERVGAFLAALEADDAEEAGRLMVASHRSSRDDHRSSTAELDVLVEELLAAGALGARLTGGGFGGCVVALCPADAAADQAARAAFAYRRRVGREPVVHLVHPAPGAREIDGEVTSDAGRPASGPRPPHPG